MKLKKEFIHFGKNKMKIIYRISDTGYSKVKPEYINNEACLKNALEVLQMPLK
jgi:hypothetical protein